eukprot:g5457.t1
MGPGPVVVVLLTLFLALSSPHAAKGGHPRRDKGQRPGTCIFIEKVSGEDLEAGQDAGSLRKNEGAEVSPANAATYATIQTDSDGLGEFEMYFAPPAIVVDGSAMSMTVNLSVLVATGSGGDWLVDLYDRSTDTWTNIGDLSTAGDDWTMVSLTITSSELAIYLDAESGNEMLVRVMSNNPGSEQAPEGTILFIERISGEDFEAGQDSESLQASEAASLASENADTYATIRTDSVGVGQFDMFFSAPSLIIGGTATSFTVELSALVPYGSGGSWLVDIFDRSTDTWTNIGDLSSAGDDWTLVSLMLEGDDLTIYLDTNFDNEMLVRVITNTGSEQLGYIDFARITATAGGSTPETITPSPVVPEGSAGSILFIERISGENLEAGQDSESLQAREAASISAENAVTYATIRTDSVGAGQFDMFFSAPSLIVGGTASSLTVELSALVPGGSGGSWLVDIFDRSTDTWTNIGDLSSAGDDWTLVSLTLEGDDLTIYLDTNFDNEMLVRVITNTGTEQLGYLDFAQITATAGVSPPEAATPSPLVPQGAVGTVLFIERISGEDLEAGQDSESLQASEAASISSDNSDTYATIRTDSVGLGQFDMFFSAPALIVSGIATSLTVELSALVPNGSGGSWLVDIFDRSTDTWTNVGDLSLAGDDWTLVSLTLEGDDLTIYLDTNFGNEMLVRVITNTPGTEQLGYIDMARITAIGEASVTPSPFSEPVPPSPESPEGTAGTVLFIEKVSGQDLEAGQDSESLQTNEAASISPENAATYATIQSDASGVGQLDIFFSAPSLVVNGTATSLTVELSALVPNGSGGSWLVDIFDRSTDTWTNIGDLSSAGDDWTLVSLTLEGSDLTIYLDTNFDNEMLVRVITNTPGTEQLGYVDFAQIIAMGEAFATPSPSSEPVPPSPEVPEGTAGVVLFIEKVSGQDLETGQDSESLQTNEAASISSENAATYATIQTDANGVGELDIFFSAPSLVVNGTATSLTVELSALVPGGSGGDWLVDIFDRSTDTWTNIGDLSSAGDDWTLVSLTLEGDDLTIYLDTNFDNEMLVRVITNTGSEQLGYIDFAQITATAGGSPMPSPSPGLDTPSPEVPGGSVGAVGTILFIGNVSGQPLEAGQDAVALQANEAASISPENTATYATIRTDATGLAEFSMFFSPPSLVVGGTATALTVELSALVTTGSSSSWAVDIFDRSTDTWTNIGDLSSVGDDWTLVLLTVTGSDLTIYLDAEFGNEMLVRVLNRNPGTELVGYIDFTQITATAGVPPAPTPTVAPATPEPVAPVAAPPVAVGSQERWAAFAQFVPDWEDFIENRGNGECDPLEECRTDPACCDTSTPAVCGNGFCEEGETRLGCTVDCTHHNAVCGNGVCEQAGVGVAADLGTCHVNMYENEYNCPVDCILEPNSPNLDVFSSVTGSCFMSDSTCDNVCGDGICTGTDTCESCPRDCGECPPIAGDGICSYPFEVAGVGDCDGSSITNFVTYDGEDYATIDNAEVLDGVFGVESCSSTPLAVPAGWRLADWDEAVALTLVTVLGAKFDTFCLVFDEGNAVNTDDGLQGNSTTGCGVIPIDRYNGNKIAINPENCASRLMIQRIKASGSKTCPSCGNGAICNTLTGKCACNGMWTGPTCERALGDYSVPAPASSWYQPPLGTTWEWQIDGLPIPGGNGAGELHNVELYDIDISYPSAVVADLQSKGKKVMCYVSAGTAEEFRDDINLFPEEVKGGIVSFGEGDTFPDEKWLDLRRLDLVASIMLDRLDIMKAKGCDAVEWDNADLPVHSLGLSDGGQVTVGVQIAYNAWIAAQTHARGMGVAMKNNNEAAAFLVPNYDMVVNEECWINGNCNNYWPWIKAGKPVLNTEYFTTRCMYCTQANLMDMSTIKKVPDLTSCRVDCKSGFESTQCDAASVSGTASFPIDWTVGIGAVMNEDWCPMTLNTDPDECPSDRFFVCDPAVGY